MNNNKGNKYGFDSSVFIKAVQLSSKTRNYVKVEIFDAIVIAGSQDEDKMTCYVNSKDSKLNNIEVRYHLCIDDGEVDVPADDSLVTIAKTSFTDPYIVKFTDLKSKTISIGNQLYSNDGEKQIFDFYQQGGTEGSFGGFVKLIDPESETSGLLYRINQLENSYNSLLDKWNMFCSVYAPGSPATTGLPATLTTSSIPKITKTIRKDLENINIIHGLKIKQNE